MSKSWVLKLIAPVLYGCALSLLLLATWPTSPHIYTYLGAALIAIGLVLWIIARIQLGDSFSLGAKASRLVTKGLYARFRHPVYYFSTLTIIGLGIYLWDPTIGVIVFVLVLLQGFRIAREESVLKERFGKAYTRYREKTWL